MEKNCPHPDPGAEKNLRGQAGQCRRCGTCCKKGGPALHLEDKALVETGILPLHDLFTVRENEPVFDQIQGKVIHASSDIIKIKGKSGFQNCLYFDESAMSCRIYGNRPLECRVLMCWDTSAIARVYRLNRLRRRDLVSGISGLWDLVESHSTEVDYRVISRLIHRRDIHENREAQQTLGGILAYDGAIRELAEQKMNLDARLLDFLFGRPLKDALRGFGIEVDVSAGRLVIKQKGSRRVSPVDIM